MNIIISGDTKFPSIEMMIVYKKTWWNEDFHARLNNLAEARERI